MNEYLILLYYMSCMGCTPQRCCEPPKRECPPPRCEPPCQPQRCECGRSECCGEPIRDFFGVTSQIFGLEARQPVCPPPPCKQAPRPEPRRERCDQYSRYNPRYRHW